MKELEIKTERLVQMLNAENLGGVLLNAQHNFAWLTGGKNNGVDLSQANGNGSLLIRNDGKRFIIANKVEMPRFLTEEVSEKDFEPIEFDWQSDTINGSFVPETAQTLLDKPLATDLFYNPNFRVVEGLIAKCRYQLTTEEIERFRKLGRDAGEVIGNVYKKIKVRQTEKEIANQVRFELGKFGINPVVTLVAADERIKKYRHAIPTENVWQKTLMIVVCAKRDGLIASLSRIFSAGKVDDDLRTRTDAVAKVFAQMLHSTRVGATGKEIFEKTVKVYSDVGFAGEELKHHQGGAAGYKTRDWVAHSESAEQIFVNQAFAWNPSISGTKAEQTVILTNVGLDYITATTEFPSIRVVIDDDEYFSPDILVI